MANTLKDAVCERLGEKGLQGAKAVRVTYEDNTVIDIHTPANPAWEAPVKKEIKNVEFFNTARAGNDPEETEENDQAPIEQESGV